MRAKNCASCMVFTDSLDMKETMFPTCNICSVHGKSLDKMSMCNARVWYDSLEEIYTHGGVVYASKKDH